MYYNETYNSEIMKWRPYWTPSWISQNVQWCQLGII